MAQKKIPQTHLLVEGLLNAADKIGTTNTDERNYLRGCIDWTKFTGSQVRGFGRYQGRVVLIALAAELALKAVWEREVGKNGVAPTHHRLKDLFDCLPLVLRERVELEYRKAATHPDPGWETPQLVFERCNHAYKTWEYLGEEGKKPEWRMQAKWLSVATKSVINAACHDLDM